MEIQNLIDEYTQWLRNEISVEPVGDYYKITTPFLDAANDYIQFYVKLDSETVFFTDDGSTLNQLSVAGFQLNPTRKEQLKSILSRYGVALEGDCLVCKSGIRAFPQRKHMFVQAIMAVDDLFMSIKGRSSSYFLSDVHDFFLEKKIYFSDNVQFTGISGLSHNYDFLLQRSSKSPERLCRVINNPDKNSTVNVLFAWNDTKMLRKEDSKLVVLLNDAKPISSSIEDAFINYEAKVIKWKDRDRDEVIDYLRA